MTLDPALLARCSEELEQQAMISAGEDAGCIASPPAARERVKRVVAKAIARRKVG